MSDESSELISILIFGMFVSACGCRPDPMFSSRPEDRRITPRAATGEKIGNLPAALFGKLPWVASGQDGSSRSMRMAIRTIDSLRRWYFLCSLSEYFR